MVRPRSAYGKISKQAFLEKTKRRSNQKKRIGKKWHQMGKINTQTTKHRKKSRSKHIGMKL